MKSKKELKLEYQEMNPVMGVFMATNQANGLRLIDSSPDIMAKWNRHRMELRFGSHRIFELQQDWKKFGEDSFVFEILAELKPSNEENPNYHMQVKKLEESIIENLKIHKTMIY